MTIVGDIKERGRERCASGRSSSTASSRRVRAPSAARSRARRCSSSPTACAAGTRRSDRPTSRSRSSRASCSSGAGSPLDTVGDLRAAEPRLDARHVRRAGAGRGRASGSSSARRPPARGSSPRPPSCSASTRSGRSAGRRRSAGSPTSERVDKIVGPGNAYVNDAKLEVSRDVAIDLPGGPSEVVVLGDGDADRARRARARRAARARPRRGLPRRRDARGGGGASRPSTSCCSARPRRAPAEVRNAGAVFVGPSSPVAAGDYATGGNHVLPTNGWARSVGGLGLETFLKPVTMQRLTAAGPRAASGRRSRRSPRPRACPRTRRRCGDESARARVPAVHLGDADRRGRAARRHRPVAGAALRPEHAAAAAAARRGRARSPARSRGSTATRPGGYRDAARGDRRLHRRRRRSRSCSAPAPTT